MSTRTSEGPRVLEEVDPTSSVGQQPARPLRTNRRPGHLLQGLLDSRSKSPFHFIGCPCKVYTPYEIESQRGKIETEVPWGCYSQKAGLLAI